MAREHDHAIGADSDRRLLLGALGLIVAFMAVEVVVGLLIDSLALLADRGRDRARPGRDAAGRQAGLRRLHVRAEAG